MTYTVYLVGVNTPAATQSSSITAGVGVPIGDTIVLSGSTGGSLGLNSWLVSDTKGNYYTISYTNDTANGQTYPVEIDYTGNAAAGLAPHNKVQFVYATRPDVWPGASASPDDARGPLRLRLRLRLLRLLLWRARQDADKLEAGGGPTWISDSLTRQPS